MRRYLVLGLFMSACGGDMSGIWLFEIDGFSGLECDVDVTSQNFRGAYVAEDDEDPIWQTEETEEALDSIKDADSDGVPASLDCDDLDEHTRPGIAFWDDTEACMTDAIMNHGVLIFGEHSGGNTDGDMVTLPIDAGTEIGFFLIPNDSLANFNLAPVSYFLESNWGYTSLSDDPTFTQVHQPWTRS